MNFFKIYFIAIFLLFGVTVFAQVQINRPVELVGNTFDAKIKGIKSVTDSLDATSVESIQSGILIYAVASGSNNNFFLNISPPINFYQPGMVFNFLSNQTITGSTTLNINNLGAKPITKSVNMPLAGCEIQNNQAVTVVFDGTNFQMTSALALFGPPPTTSNAGPDQLNVTANTTVNLAANIPSNGTGVWNLISGAGGTIASPSSPTSTFTGQPLTTYTLVWAISNSCATSTDTVIISFASCAVPGTQTFNYSGSIANFTVPVCITSITIQAYGAQGGDGCCSASVPGGKGAYILGTVNVTPGDILGILVGQQGGFRSGGGGGSFIWNTSNANTLLVAAGGGGGGGDTNNGSVAPTAGDGQITTTTSSGGGTGTAAGGTGGNGGTGGAPNPVWSGSGGGAGWSSNGADGQYGGEAIGTGGASPVNGGAAGNAGLNGGVGGYGGGGGATYPGGGGGGYNGGGGGNAWIAGGGNYAGGGGGGSSYYINGIPGNGSASGFQSGNGLVVLTW